MKIRNMIRWFGCLSLFVSAGMWLTGCTDDKIDVPTSPDGIYSVDEDEYALGVTLSLDQLSGSIGSRALGDLGDKGLAEIEEYVNTENLVVLFFNIDGIFLFNIENPTAIPIGQSDSGLDNQWFIKIPVKQINDNLIKYIEENPFKIAVLANWTYLSDRNTGGKLDAFEFKAPLDADGNLTYDEMGKLTGMHISELAHAQVDNAYENTTMHGYDHLVYRTETGPHMSPYIEWVHNYHKSIDVADADIRANFDVKNNKYQTIDAENHYNVTFQNLWQVWNFGGKNTDNADFDFGSEKNKADWLALNEKAQKDLFDQYKNNSGSYYDSFYWRLDNYEPLEISYPKIIMWENASQNDEPSTIKGVVFPLQNLSWDDNESGEPLNLEAKGYGPPTPYIRFKANADGYVKVNYEARGGAKLFVHVGRNNTPENNASNYHKDNIDSRFELDENGYFSTAEIADIPFEPKDVYIYMVIDPNYTQPEPEEGQLPLPPESPVAYIYGVEYIESRHLYDVDRRGILPDKDYPIPMYGIQDFDAIGEYWEPGILFNLSQFNNAQKQGYSYRNISLLRSLARVELRLAKKDFPKKPTHVFLRSQNRSARIMPVDFFTPTDIVWNGFNPSSQSDVKRLQNYINSGNLNEQNIIQNTPGHKGELDNIMQYGPIYIGSNNNQGQSGSQKLDEYRKTTAWPFGIWEQQWGWDWNRGTGYVSDFATYKPGQTRAHTGQVVPEYPRILHTRISRSDYARFTEIDDGSEYWHYIIYTAEKNITDADNPGNIADRPKIIHIELRFNGGLPEKDNAEDNTVNNFDDNGAYRLYFTEGGRASLGDFNFTGRESWDAYEYDWNIAKQHWPILRNHIYSFTVTGGIGNRSNINFQVAAPDNRSIYWEFN